MLDLPSDADVYTLWFGIEPIRYERPHQRSIAKLIERHIMESHDRSLLVAFRHRIVGPRLRLTAALNVCVWILSSLNMQAGDVPWLKDVTAIPAGATLESPGRIEPLLISADGTPITTLDQWNEHRNSIRESWLKFLGPMPSPRPAVKLEILKTEEVSVAGKATVIRQLIRYEGEPGIFVEGYALRPQTVASNAKLPAVLALHPTTNATIDDIAGVSGQDTKQFGLTLAQRGFITFCPRCFLWENVQSLNEAVAKHRQRHPETTGMAKMLYDAMRAMDVLAAIPNVDTDRIGAIGHSLGAKEALYLAAFDERVKVAVASEGGIGFRTTNWDASWYLGESIRDEEFPLNHHQLLALIAPRPFLVLGGETGPGAADGDRSWVLMQAALPAWKMYGEPARLGMLNHHEGHSVSPESFERMSEWLTAYLR
jgi:pimeloyl-ACP methyl ester carboxylesterase